MDVRWRPAWERFAAKFGTLEGDIEDFLDPPRVVPTGIAELDAHLSGGMTPGVYVLMARPGAGKSALALRVAINVAAGNGNVLYVSLEMTRQQCLARCCSALSAMEEDIPTFYWSGWEEMGRIARLGMGGPQDASEADMRRRVDETPAVRALRRLSKRCPGLAFTDGYRAEDIDRLVGTVMEAADRELDMLVIDYLQRIAPSESTRDMDRYRQITEASNALTSLTKHLHFPALVISSMNRSGMDADKPTMTGGRGSGDIEFDAMAVMQLVADKRPMEDGMRGVDLHITKCRRGTQTDEGSPIRLVFDGRYNLFYEAGR